MLEALRETLLEAAHFRGDEVGGGQCIGARLQENADQCRGLAVDAAAELVILRGQLDAGDVLQPQQRAIGVGTDDDVLEFRGLRKTALGGDGVDQFLSSAAGRLADLAGGKLRVLLVERTYQVAGRDLQLRHAVRTRPDAHGIVLGTEDLHVGGARDALERIEHVQCHVVRDEQVVVTAVGRGEGNHLQEGGGALLDSDTLAPHFLRQARFNLFDAVVDVERGGIDIGADLEGDLDFNHALRCRGRAHVEHLLDTGDLVFKRRGNGLLDDRRRGARIDRAYGDHRRRDFGVLRDRQRAHRGEAGDDDENRQYGRKYRPVDEEFGDHGVSLYLLSGPVMRWLLLRLFWLRRTCRRPSPDWLCRVRLCRVHLLSDQSR